jgi:hypothetical protein
MGIRAAGSFGISSLLSQSRLVRSGVTIFSWIAPIGAFLHRFAGAEPDRKVIKTKV